MKVSRGWVGQCDHITSEINQPMHSCLIAPIALEHMESSSLSTRYCRFYFRWMDAIFSLHFIIHNKCFRNVDGIISSSHFKLILYSVEVESCLISLYSFSHMDLNSCLVVLLSTVHGDYMYFVWVCVTLFWFCVKWPRERGEKIRIKIKWNDYG